MQLMWLAWFLGEKQKVERISFKEEGKSIHNQFIESNPSVWYVLPYIAADIQQNINQLHVGAGSVQSNDYHDT